MKQPKIPKLGDHIKELDRVFSLYIRQRDMDSSGNIRCISCGKSVPWRSSHAGHYYSRRHRSLRWDEKNVHAQCAACNIFNQGNAQGYARGIISRYGQEVLDYLEIKKSNTSKMGVFEIHALISYYLEILINESWQVR